MLGWVIVRSVMVGSMALVGCGGLSAVPDQGGPRWCRLESEHFVLESDQPEASARKAITTFERSLDAFFKLGWEVQGGIAAKLHVIVFDDRADFRVFGGDDAEGFYLQSPLLDPLVVMPSVGRLSSWSTLQHELTHFISAQSLPNQPPWLSEGLAMYFERAYFDGSQQFVVGAAPLEFHGLLVRYGRMSIKELWTGSPDMDPHFYASAWLTVHYLMSERGDAFASFQAGLMNGLDPDHAWAAAFPDLSLDRLDEALDAYLSAGRFANYRLAMQPYSGPEPKLTWLSTADVYAKRARLYLHCHACGADKHAAAKENAAQALSREPQHLLATIVQSALGPADKRLAAAQAAAAAHPNEWLAWAFLGSEELEANRCSPEVAPRLSALGTASGYALMIAALCRATEGAREEALSLAEKALLVQPASSALLLLQARIFKGLGECAALAQLATRLRAARHPQLTAAQLAPFSTCQ